jgi:hypothetical protein
MKEKKMTETNDNMLDTVREWEAKLDVMSQRELARLHRFAPSGHPVFDTGLPLHTYFKTKFNGMTPELSKAIGWDD